MTMMRSRKNILLVSLAAMALSAVGGSAASASPVWKFGGTELTGTEAVVGIAPSTLTIPGSTTTCKHTLLFLKISNVGGVGKGEVTKLLLFECTTGSNCAVESIEAEKLPWPLHLATFLGKDYLVIEKVQIGVLYSGALCPLAGTLVTVKGSAGGLFETATSTLVFNGTTLSATGTSLKVGSTAIEWKASFPLEALGAHSGEALEG